MELMFKDGAHPLFHFAGLMTSLGTAAFPCDLKQVTEHHRASSSPLGLGNNYEME